MAHNPFYLEDYSVSVAFGIGWVWGLLVVEAD